MFTQMFKQSTPSKYSPTHLNLKQNDLTETSGYLSNVFKSTPLSRGREGKGVVADCRSLRKIKMQKLLNLVFISMFKRVFIGIDNSFPLALH